MPYTGKPGSCCVAFRLAELRANMEATLHGIKALAEGASRPGFGTGALPAFRPPGS